MLRAILVDDDESNLSSLREKMARYCHDVEIVAACDTAAKAIASIENHRPELVFFGHRNARDERLFDVAAIAV